MAMIVDINFKQDIIGKLKEMIEEVKGMAD